MAYYNGANRDGTLFGLPLIGGTTSTVLSFSGSNGANPAGSLTISGSTLYGITSNGGAYGYGTIFSVPVGGGAITTLLSFTPARAKTRPAI